MMWIGCPMWVWAIAGVLLIVPLISNREAAEKMIRYAGTLNRGQFR